MIILNSNQLKIELMPKNWAKCIYFYDVINIALLMGWMNHFLLKFVDENYIELWKPCNLNIDVSQLSKQVIFRRIWWSCAKFKLKLSQYDVQMCPMSTLFTYIFLRWVKKRKSIIKWIVNNKFHLFCVIFSQYLQYGWLIKHASVLKKHNNIFHLILKFWICMLFIELSCIISLHVFFVYIWDIDHRSCRLFQLFLKSSFV